MNNPKYRFYIDDKIFDLSFSNNLSKEISKEPNQQFFREKLSGKIKAVGCAFDYIVSKGFRHKFDFKITLQYVSEDEIDYFKGSFHHIDCTFDYDYRKVEFNVNPLDPYSKILSSIDKEFNIVDLEPEMVMVNVSKRPLIQVYVAGDDTVSNFVAGSNWDTDIEIDPISDHKKLVQDYYFSLNRSLRLFEINATNVSESDQVFNGQFYGTYVEDGESVYKKVGDGNVRIKVSQTDGPLVSIAAQRFASGEWINRFTALPGKPYQDPMKDWELDGVKGVSGTLRNGYRKNNSVYMRYLLDADKIGDVSTHDVPSQDIVPNNLNYRKVIGLEASSIHITEGVGEVPTKWGLSDLGGYFVEPTSYFGKGYPIGRKEWTTLAYWFSYSSIDSLVEPQARVKQRINAAYRLSSVIKRVLKEIDPDVSFDELPWHSEFFYADNNPINTDGIRLVIVPKSNVMHGNKAIPASVANLTLGEIFKMLRDVFKVYWYIDKGRLRLEHIKYFMNGGSYDYRAEVGVDLTACRNARNGLPLSFGQNTISFEKVDMPERYQFEWGDNTSMIFKGWPIEVVSEHVNEGLVEDIMVSKFTTDVDFTMMNPQDVSPDGFLLLGITPGNHSIDYPARKGFYGFYEDSKGVIKVEVGRLVEGIEAYRYIHFEAAKGDTIHVKFKTKTKKEMPFILATDDSHLAPVGDPAYLSYRIDNSDVDDGEFIFSDFWGMNHLFYFRVEEEATIETSITDKMSVIELLSFRVYRRGEIIHEELNVPFLDYEKDNEEYRIQNGYLSWPIICSRFQAYDVPSNHIIINKDENIFVSDTQKKKKQEVSFTSKYDIDTVKFIKTAYGTGQIEKINVNLSSREIKANLVYNVE